METKQKIMAIAGAVLIAGASFGAGAVLMPKEVVKEVPVTVEKIVTVEKPVEVIKEVKVPVEVIKTVKVDNENLNKVLTYLQENYASEEVFDVDKDSLDLIVTNILYEDMAVLSAEQLVQKEGISFIDDETDLFEEGVLDQYRKTDIYSFKVDSDDTVLTSIDYEHQESTIEVIVRLKAMEDGDSDTKVIKSIKFEVESDNGEYKIISAELI